MSCLIDTEKYRQQTIEDCGVLQLATLYDFCIISMPSSSEINMKKKGSINEGAKQKIPRKASSSTLDPTGSKPECTAPSSTSNAAAGRHMLNSTLRSVISHQYSLALILYINKEGVENNINKEENIINKEEKRLLDFIKTFEEDIGDFKTSFEFGQIVEQAVECNKNSKENISEAFIQRTFCAYLKEKMNDITVATEKTVGLGKTRGRFDMGFYIPLGESNDESLEVSNDKPSKKNEPPYMILEFGKGHGQWWKKFDQAVKYAEILEDNGSLLLSAVTFEITDKGSSVRIGVFFYQKKKGKRQISLIWHKHGSFALFNKLVEITLFFKKLITTKSNWEYEYYSSNCCKFGDRVYRCYDNRFRYTSRSDDAYREPSCMEITGKVKEILTVQEEVFVMRGLPQNKGDIWFKEEEEGKEKSLKIISTPFRHGGHIAKKPSDFIPIINKLKKLHSKGYIHGDIRAFNMIFGANDGWLIDFDFSCKQLDGTSKPQYPNGYVRALTDGLRFGESDGKMEQWHDWYALGNVIFQVHRISNKDADAPNERLYRLDLKEFWTSIKNNNPSNEDIDVLIEFLGKKGLKVEPSIIFESMKPNEYDVTNIGATGSPPKV